jgi:ribosome-binding protein aMBF1 (putative translation factor)
MSEIIVCPDCGKIGKKADHRKICIECRRKQQRARDDKKKKPPRKHPVLDNRIASVLSSKW